MTNLELWLTERETDHVLTKCRIDRTLYQGVRNTSMWPLSRSREYGRMLVLDGIVQTSIRDEFIYHEMIAHVPLTIHPRPKGLGHRGRRRRHYPGSAEASRSEARLPRGDR